MGACLSASREDGFDGDENGGRTGESGRRRRRSGRSAASSGSRNRRDSTASDNSDSLSSSQTTKNRPLRHQSVRWKSDIPLTEAQLKSKREEFWHTAPAFEGKQEIWMALKAATEAAEDDDYELAQAMLDGAGISLPHGSLLECYDELGTRYVIPIYCLSRPLNLSSSDDGRDSPADHSEPVSAGASDGKDIKVRIRVSLTGNDVRAVVNTAETVGAAKRRLHEQNKPRIPEPARQRWYYGGKTMRDKYRIGAANISPGHVIQCVISQLDFDVIEAS